MAKLNPVSFNVCRNATISKVIDVVRLADTFSHFEEVADDPATSWKLVLHGIFLGIAPGDL